MVFSLNDLAVLFIVGGWRHVVSVVVETSRKHSRFICACMLSHAVGVGW